MYKTPTKVGKNDPEIRKFFHQESTFIHTTYSRMAGSENTPN